MVDSLGQSIESVLLEKGEIITSTAGTSMYPMLRNKRDMVVIKKVDGPFKKHDVPVYRLKSGKIVMHRILKVTKDGYIIRGDNLYKNELDITDNNIIGVLKAFYRNGKYYDVETSKKYKLYVLWVRISYPVRFVLCHLIRPQLGKLKRFLLGKLKSN